MAIQQEVLRLSKDIPKNSDIEKEATDISNGTTVVLGRLLTMPDTTADSEEGRS